MVDGWNCRDCKDLQPHFPNCANAVRPICTRLILGEANKLDSGSYIECGGGYLYALSVAM